MPCAIYSKPPWESHNADPEALEEGLSRLQWRFAHLWQSAPATLALAVAVGHHMTVQGHPGSLSWVLSEPPSRWIPWAKQQSVMRREWCSRSVTKAGPEGTRSCVKRPHHPPLLQQPCPQLPPLAACGWLGKTVGGGGTPWEGLQMVPLVIHRVERDPKLKHIQPHAQPINREKVHPTTKGQQETRRSGYRQVFGSIQVQA